MKNLLKKVVGLDLVKVTGLNGISTIIRVIMSFGLSKYLAVMIGPSGLAIIGQLTNVTQAMTTIGTLASNNAVTKYSAEYLTDRQRYLAFISSTLKAVLCMSAVVGLFSFVASGWLSQKIFATDAYASIFKIFAFTIVLFACNGFLLSLINGKKLFRKYVIINIVTSVVSTLLTFVMIWFYGIYGGLVSYVTAQSVVLLFTAYLAKSELSELLAAFTHYSIDKDVVKKVLLFSTMTLVSMLLSPASKLWIRSEIIYDLGIDAAGIWEGINKISGLYLMLFTATIPIYYLPRLSEIKSLTEFRAEVFTSLKVVLPVVMISALAIFVLRYYIIIIALSNEFLPMKDLFLPQLIGDMLRVVSLLFVYTLIAKAKVKHYIVLECIAVGVYVLLSIYGMRYYGLIGVIYAYAVSYGIYALLAFLLFQNRFSTSS